MARKLIRWGGSLFGRLLIIVRGRKLVLRANAKGFPDQSSTAVASTLQLPAIFLGGKTCCAFDCTPNVDTAIENRRKDEKKSYATGYACNSCLQKGITIVFANKMDNVIVQIMLVV